MSKADERMYSKRHNKEKRDRKERQLERERKRTGFGEG